MSSATEIATLIIGGVGGSAGIGTAIKYTLDYRAKARKEADDAVAKRSDAVAAAATQERTDVIALLRDEITKGEARGERSAERAEAIATALTAAANSQSEFARAVEQVPRVIDALNIQLSMRFERVERELAALREGLTTGRRIATPIQIPAKLTIPETPPTSAEVAK